MAIYTGTSGVDNFPGTAGADTFRFRPAYLSELDTITGRGGDDTLEFTVAGTIGATALSGVSSIETIKLFNGGANGLTLNDTVAGANAAVLYILDGSGNDIVDASAVTLTSRAINVTSGAGSDTLRGGAGDDVFRFSAADLTADDVVQGNGGSDTLQFITAGAISAAALAGVSGIETIRLYASGSNSVTLDDPFASANPGLVRFISGAGNDTIDASAVWDTTSKIEVTSGSGDDTLKGGAGNDVFRFAIADLTAADFVQGNGGSDTLQFITSGAISAAALAGVSGIETIGLLNSGTNILTLDDVFADANPGILRITGGAGNDTVDASGVSLSYSSLDVTAGTGNDTLRGGAGSDLFRFAATALTAADTVQGNGGYDTLQFSAAGKVTASALAGVSGIEIIRLFNGSINSIALNDAVVSANPMLVVLGGVGNDTIDASAVTLTDSALYAISGVGNDTIKGGAGNDVFGFDASALTGADIVQGNDGFDTLDIATAGTVTAAALAGVSGIERIRLLTSGTNILTLNNAFASANAEVLYIGADFGNHTVDASAVTLPNRGIVVSSLAGNVTLKGGAGDDLFLFTTDGLTYADKVQGNGGYDTLAFYNPGALSATALANVKGIEEFELYGSGAGNSLKLTNAVAAANAPILNINTGYGSSNVDASAVTLTDRAIWVTSFGGDVTLRGGAGRDIFSFYYSFTAADTVRGKGGQDTLQIIGTQPITAATLANVSGIETISLIGDYTSLTLNNTVVAANATGPEFVVDGSDGSDTFDASAVTLTDRGIFFVSVGGIDTLKGGAGNDSFIFRIADLTSSDVVQGNGGSDTLIFNTVGTVDAASLANVSGIEAIWFTNSSGDSVLTLDDRFAAANGPVLYISTNFGNDTIDASAVTLSNRAIYVRSGAGVDTLKGGAGDDVFWFQSGALTAADTVQGNDGFDTLEFFVAGSVSAESLSGVSGIEAITFISGTNSLTLDDAFASANTDEYNSTTRIFGSLGDDTIDASAVTLSSYSITVMADSGDDTLKGGAGEDVFVFNFQELTSRDTVQGNGGIDTLVFTAPGAALTPDMLANVSGIEEIAFQGEFNSLTLDDAFASANGPQLSIVGGSDSDTVDASAVTLTDRSFSISGGSGADTLKGGAGNDTIAGGSGTDTLTGGGGQDGFLFEHLGAANADTITDFDVADDAILLSHAAFASFAGTGTISANSFVAGTAAIDGDDYILFDSATGKVFYDSDGSGASEAVLFATVTPGLTLTYLDFVVV